MDGDGAAREAELRSLREKNEELRGKLREQRHFGRELHVGVSRGSRNSGKGRCQQIASVLAAPAGTIGNTCSAVSTGARISTGPG